MTRHMEWLLPEARVYVTVCLSSLLFMASASVRGQGGGTREAGVSISEEKTGGAFSASGVAEAKYGGGIEVGYEWRSGENTGKIGDGFLGLETAGGEKEKRINVTQKLMTEAKARLEFGRGEGKERRVGRKERVGCKGRMSRGHLERVRKEDSSGARESLTVSTLGATVGRIEAGRIETTQLTEVEVENATETSIVTVAKDSKVEEERIEISSTIKVERPNQSSSESDEELHTMSPLEIERRDDGLTAGQEPNGEIEELHGELLTTSATYEQWTEVKEMARNRTGGESRRGGGRTGGGLPPEGSERAAVEVDDNSESCPPERISHQSVSYEGDAVLKIDTPSRHHLAALKSILQTHLPIEEIDIWRLPDERERSVDVFVRCARLRLIKHHLQKQGFIWTYLIRDIDSYIKREQWYRKKRSTRTGDIVGKFVRLGRIESWLRKMSRIHSNITTLHYIGKSHQGRPMAVLKIGKGRGRERAVWIDAGLHAREWVAPASAIFLIHKLLKNYRSDDEVRRFVEDYSWYFLVVANPDGYEFSFTKYRFWRKNRRPVDYNCTGVDLNRNWGYMWGGADASPNPCSVVYRGPNPESEPEVSNVINFLSSRRNDFILYFSLHSYGQKMLGRWAFADNILPEDHDSLLTIAQRAARVMSRQHQRRYEAGTAAELMCKIWRPDPYSGGSADWARGHLGVKYSYVAELRDEGVYGFLLPPGEIVPTGQEVWAGVKVFMRYIYKNDFIQTQTSIETSSTPSHTPTNIFLSNNSSVVTLLETATTAISSDREVTTLSNPVTSVRSYLVLPQQRNNAEKIRPVLRFCLLSFIFILNKL